MTDPVLFVTHSAQLSGAEKVMLDLAAECRRRGIAVAVACPSGPLSEALSAGVDHIEIPALGRDHARRSRLTAVASMARAYLAAGRVLRRHRHRRVVANSSHTLPAVRLAGFESISWLVHDHVVDAKFAIFIRIGRSIVNRAVAVSETTADAVRPHVGSVRTGRLGVEIPHSPRDAAASRATGAVGTMSVITPWKGLHVFLEAVSRLPDVRAVVAGEAFPGDLAYADGLYQRSRAPDLEGRVRFPGHVHAATALAQWSVHVSASVKPEAGPLTVLEAMAAGVPVVATDHGGPRRLLAEGRGVLVAPDDAEALAAGIATLLADPEHADAVAARAYAYVVAHHDRRRTLPALLDLLLGPVAVGVRG